MGIYGTLWNRLLVFILRSLGAGIGALFISGCMDAEIVDVISKQAPFMKISLSTESTTLDLDEGVGHQVTVALAPIADTVSQQKIPHSENLGWTLTDSDGDFEVGSGSFIVTPTTTSISFIIKPLKDALLESDETFTLKFHGSRFEKIENATLEIVVKDKTTRAELKSSFATLDFGPRLKDIASEAAITFTNGGDAPANDLNWSSLSAPFSYKGGLFPGVGGTCNGTSIEGHTSCTVVVSYLPTEANTHNNVISWSYLNPDQSKSGVVAITGSGVEVATTLGGAPTNPSNVDSLGISVTGFNITHYKYKLGPAASTDCSAPSGYSLETAISESIDDSLASLANQNLKLCVVGKDSNNLWQPYTSATSHSWLLDTLRPSITIHQKSGQADPTSSLPIRFLITFNEPISEGTLSNSDIQFTGSASVNSFTLSKIDSTNFEMTVSALDNEGTVIPEISAAQVLDLAGNGNTDSTATDNSVLYDSTAPLAPTSLTWLQTSPSNAVPLTATWTLSASNDISTQRVQFYQDASCLTPVGSLLPVASSSNTQVLLGTHGSTYTYKVSVADASGNLSLSACSSAMVFDSASPSLLSYNPATSTRSFFPSSVVVSFSKDMSAASISNLSNWAVACSGAGVVSIVSASPSDTDEATLNLDTTLAPTDGEVCTITAKNTLADVAGNTLATASQVQYTMDLPGQILQVTSSTANGSYKLNDVITIQVQFSENVYVAGGTPNLSLEVGSTDRYAVYSSGSGTNTLAFAYTVAAGDNSSDLDYDAITALLLNGATIKDSFGNDIPLTLPSPGEPGSLAANKNIVIDTQAPDAFDLRGITGGTDATEDEWLTNGEEATIHWNASTGSNQYKVEILNADGSANVCPEETTTTNSHTFAGCTLANGSQYQVSLKALDFVGNETLASNSPYLFTVNTSAVIATLANQPTGRTNQTNLNITVGGSDILTYRYKVGLAASTVCSNATGYSSDTLISQQITDSIAGLGSGLMRVCVIGKNSANVEQLLASASTATWTQDLVAPSLTINQKSGQTDPTNTLPAEFTIVFSEAINPATFAVSDIVQGGTASGITWTLTTSNNITYSLKATAVTTPGTLIPSIAVGTVKDIAGNDNTTSTSTDHTITYETSKPTLTINQKAGQSDPTNALPIQFTVVFSEEIQPSSFDISDISQGGTASGITWNLSTSDNITYNLSATAIATPGSVIPSVAISKVSDIAGNLNTSSTFTDNSVTHDLTKPIDATTLSWQQTSPTNLTTIVAQWVKSTSPDLNSQKVRFYSGGACETYTGTEVLTSSSATTASFTGTNGSTYTYQVISTDKAGNSSTSGCSTALLIDTTPSTITNVTSNKTNGAYTVGAVIDIRVTFSENVTVSGTPALALNTTPARSATYTSGSGSSTLVFSYTVAATDTVADLNYAATNSLTVTSASIKDAAGNNATLTLPGLAGAGSLATNKNLVIDTTAPSITAFTVTNSSPTNSLTFNITSSVSGSPIEYCVLQNNTSVGSCTWTASATLPTSFNVTTVNESKTLSAWVRDAAGNVSARAASAAIIYDSTPPTATLSGQPTGSTNIYSLNVDVSGTDVVAYKFKIGPSASVDCTTSTGYSASELSAATNITTNISGYANGTVKLCVIGRDTAGNWQDESSATVVTWTKNSPHIQFTATTSSISEYNEPDHTVAVSIPAAAAVAVSVNYSYSNGSAPSATMNTDYTAVNGTVTIPAGSTSANITIPILDNPAEENNETFKITLSSPIGSYLGTNTVHTVTILDDEDAPLVTIQDVYVIEGATTSLKATLSHPTDKGAVVINWAQASCSGVDCAEVTTDYTMSTTSGSASVPAGSTSVTFGSVTTINNTVDELFKRVPIAISSVTGGTAYVSSADIFINDNDVPSGKNVVELASGDAHTCARAGNGKVYCWGHNSYGQLGKGDTYSSMAPVEATLPTTATKIVANRQMSCAVLTGGSAYCWGLGSVGSTPGASYTGTNTTGSRLSPTLVTDMSANVTDIGLGAIYGCALQSGAVKCWGANNYGVLGNPASVGNSLTPVAIGVLTSGVTKISVGWTHACAIKSSALYCWGENTNGEVGNGTTNLVYTPTLISGLGTVSDVWAGYYGTCAKNSSNQVYCWGNNGDWQIVTGTTTDNLSPVLMTDFASATRVEYGPTVCALISGVLKCKGRNYYGEMGLNEPTSYDINVLTTMPGATSGVTAFTTSKEGFTCFVKSNQTYCTGFSGYGQLGDSYAQQSTSHILSPDFAGASTVSIVSEAACGLYSGAVKCLGDNTNYRLGNTISDRIYYAPAVVKTLESGVSKVLMAGDGGCALKSGVLYCWGRYHIRTGTSTSGNPTTPAGMTATVTDFATMPSGNAVCSLKAGKVYCWGDYTYMQGAMGLAEGIIATPTEVTSAGSNNTKVVLGGEHICVIKSDKTVWCSGENNDGQLGQNTTTPTSSILKVPGVTAVDELALSTRGTCARSGTTLKCWGQYAGNGAEQVNTPYTHSLTNVTKVVGGFYGFCAISNGDAYCWGYNRENQHGLNDAATNEYRLSPAALTSLNAKGTVTDITIGSYGTCGKVGTSWYCSGADIGGNLGTNKKPNRLGAVSISPF